VTADPTLAAIGYLVLGWVLGLLTFMVGDLARRSLADRYHPLLTCVHGNRFDRCASCARRR
jgi:hypothetical protein